MYRIDPRDDAVALRVVRQPHAHLDRKPPPPPSLMDHLDRRSASPTIQAVGATPDAAWRASLRDGRTPSPPQGRIRSVSPTTTTAAGAATYSLSPLSSQYHPSHSPERPTIVLGRGSRDEPHFSSQDDRVPHHHTTDRGRREMRSLSPSASSTHPSPRLTHRHRREPPLVAHQRASMGANHHHQYQPISHTASRRVAIALEGLVKQEFEMRHNIVKAWGVTFSNVRCALKHDLSLMRMHSFPSIHQHQHHHDGRQQRELPHRHNHRSNHYDAADHDQQHDHKQPVASTAPLVSEKDVGDIPLTVSSRYVKARVCVVTDDGTQYSDEDTSDRGRKPSSPIPEEPPRRLSSHSSRHREEEEEHLLLSLVAAAGSALHHQVEEDCRRHRKSIVTHEQRDRAIILVEFASWRAYCRQWAKRTDDLKCEERALRKRIAEHEEGERAIRLNWMQLVGPTINHHHAKSHKERTTTTSNLSRRTEPFTRRRDALALVVTRIGHSESDSSSSVADEDQLTTQSPVHEHPSAGASSSADGTNDGGGTLATSNCSPEANSPSPQSARNERDDGAPTIILGVGRRISSSDEGEPDGESPSPIVTDRRYHHSPFSETEDGKNNNNTIVSVHEERDDDDESDLTRRIDALLEEATPSVDPQRHQPSPNRGSHHHQRQPSTSPPSASSPKASLVLKHAVPLPKQPPAASARQRRLDEDTKRWMEKRSRSAPKKPHLMPEPTPRFNNNSSRARQPYPALRRLSTPPAQQPKNNRPQLGGAGGGVEDIVDERPPQRKLSPEAMSSLVHRLSMTQKRKRPTVVVEQPADPPRRTDPKGVQKHPPITKGGASSAAIKRVSPDAHYRPETDEAINDYHQHRYGSRSKSSSQLRDEEEARLLAEMGACREREWMTRCRLAGSERDAWNVLQEHEAVEIKRLQLRHMIESTRSGDESMRADPHAADVTRHSVISALSITPHQQHHHARNDGGSNANRYQGDQGDANNDLSVDLSTLSSSIPPPTRDLMISDVTSASTPTMAGGVNISASTATTTSGTKRRGGHNNGSAMNLSVSSSVSQQRQQMSPWEKRMFSTYTEKLTKRSSELTKKPTDRR